MHCLTLSILFKSSCSDDYVNVPIDSIDHGVLIANAIGINNMDDASISEYHVHLIGTDSNPNEEHCSFSDLRQRVEALARPHTAEELREAAAVCYAHKRDE